MRQRLYRSRDGMIFGVCKGLAKHFDISAFWLRIALVVGFFMTGFFSIIIAYIVMALVIKLEPVIQPKSEAEEEFYQSYSSSGSLGLSRLKSKFDSLDQRIRRIESYVTNKAYDWERRLHGE